MVSAFQPPHKHLRDDEGEEATAQPVKTTKQTAISLDTADETEDEEVKLTCSGGIPPDSDYDSSSDDEEEEDSVTSESNEPNRFDMKVVNFVTRQIQQSVEIVSPQALRGRIIESIAEGEDLDEDNDDDASNSSSEYVARGLPLAPASCDDDSEEEESSSESDDDDNDVNDDHYPDDVESFHTSLQVDEAPELLDLEHALASYDDGTNSWEDMPIMSNEDQNLTEFSFVESAANSEPKVKRCLSRHTMLEDERESRLLTAESPKRMRFVSTHDFSQTHLTELPLWMPDLSLGPSAWLSEEQQPWNNEGAVSPSTQDEENDRQLSEELDDDLVGCCEESDALPVPLLTPPGSPRNFESDTTVMCEWPSNLASDHPMPASANLKIWPSSSDSLPRTATVEDENATEGYWKEQPINSSPSTTLTPLIKGIAFYS